MGAAIAPTGLFFDRSVSELLSAASANAVKTSTDASGTLPLCTVSRNPSNFLACHRFFIRLHTSMDVSMIISVMSAKGPTPFPFYIPPNICRDFSSLYSSTKESTGGGWI